MNQNQIDYLSKKIVQITNNIQRLLDDKTALVKSYNNEIKESRKRRNAYAKAVEADSLDHLQEIMGEFEIAEFEKIGR